MTRYLSLINYTDQGICKVKDSLARANQFRAIVQDAGGNVTETYWAIGDTDGAVIFEVPDEKVGATVLLKLADQGYVRTKTMRIFTGSEFESILSDV